MEPKDHTLAQLPLLHCPRHPQASRAPVRKHHLPSKCSEETEQVKWSPRTWAEHCASRAEEGGALHTVQGKGVCATQEQFTPTEETADQRQDASIFKHIFKESGN